MAKLLGVFLLLRVDTFPCVVLLCSPMPIMIDSNYHSLIQGNNVIRAIS